MYKWKLMWPLIAVGGVMVVPMPAFAQQTPHQEPGVFIGGGAIYTRLDNNFSGQNFNADDFDDDRVSWKAFAGFRLNPVISLEGQYIDFGKAENSTARVEADGWTAALVADIPLPYIQPYAKAGALFWNTDAHLRGALSNTSRVSSDGTDFFWGVGARADLSDNVDLRLEYERFRLNGDAGNGDDYSVDTHIDAVSVNLQYTF
ncbi:porin family protein [Solimonas terrae]|uniref:Porin family protein n=1 Tax=Solimonas terrae TaxID=1396819 RepID=A0A6M2BQH6_9GAMM|nr:porin family protein [Solimonas terrae]NGY04708.1 porin family protein [Solimonas terrae]